MPQMTDQIYKESVARIIKDYENGETLRAINDALKQMHSLYYELKGERKVSHFYRESWKEDRGIK